MSTWLNLAALAALGASALAACGSADSTEAGDSAGAGGGAGAVEETRPAASPLPGHDECVVRVRRDIPVASAEHVEKCAPVAYATNPPSGGDHDKTWAAYKTFAKPVRREHYVHNLEHGAVVAAYACAGACPDVVAALQQVVDATAPDAMCAQAGGTTSARLVLTPDPALDAPIALAAWGATYTATCIDPPSMRAFIDARYGKGPEATCLDGRDFDAEPLCP